MYANVIVDIVHEKLNTVFTYHIPERLRLSLRVGMQVQVPFGKGNRQITGYVIELTEQTAYDEAKMKEILDIRAGSESIEAKLIQLAAWMCSRYGSTMIQALKTVLPVKNKVRTQEKRMVTLAVTAAEAAKVLDVYRSKHQKARVRLLEYMIQHREEEYSQLLKQLQISAQVIGALAEQKLLLITSGAESPLQFEDETESSGSELMSDAQNEVCRKIAEEWALPVGRPVYVRGVTGSGKTQVYMQLIEETLQKGQQVILLVPEISLTYQNLKRFYTRFGSRVSALNSRLSQGEKYDRFKKAREGHIEIMLGPRSALFTPFPNLGLIIIDEEHDMAYKSETTPRYHTREVAIRRAEMEGAHVLMGSATPSTEAYTKALHAEYRLLTLEERFENRPLPEVSIVDMREELKSGNASVISEVLEAEITLRLHRKEQVMLFLNRRGYAGYVSCRACGYVAKCPHCDVSLTAHNHGKRVCHYCGYETAPKATCPICGSPHFGGVKAGTQQIEAIVQKKFPQARILRMDYDTTRRKHSHEQIVASFAREEADILIGTQMVVKGHDFAKLTLVGVLLADLSLNQGDYRAAEITFQLLTQAVGRAGRGEVAGKAVIQTYLPEHYSITTAAAQDYEAFYTQEIAFRSLLGYPPASNLLAIHGSCTQEPHLGVAMEYLKKYVCRVCDDSKLQLIGPAEESIARINDIYKKVIYLKHAEYDILVRIKDKIEAYIRINSGFKNITIQFEFN
ncbi:MAG: primosomal protein N' [Lachnospiraceae bacterium]